MWSSTLNFLTLWIIIQNGNKYWWRFINLWCYSIFYQIMETSDVLSNPEMNWQNLKRLELKSQNRATQSEMTDSWMSLWPSMHLVCKENLCGKTKAKRRTKEIKIRKIKKFQKLSAGNVKMEVIIHFNANRIRNAVQIIRKVILVF